MKKTIVTKVCFNLYNFKFPFRLRGKINSERITARDIVTHIPRGKYKGLQPYPDTGINRQSLRQIEGQLFRVLEEHMKPQKINQHEDDHETRRNPHEIRGRGCGAVDGVPKKIDAGDTGEGKDHDELGHAEHGFEDEEQLHDGE